MEIRQIRHNWHENPGFELNRPEGAGEYIFLHFLTPAELFFRNQYFDAPAGTLILFSPRTAHRFISRGELLHNWIHLTGDVKKELAPYHLQPDTLYHASQSLQITERIARLEVEFFARSSHWQLCMQSLLTEMWITISRQLNGEAPLAVTRETADLLRTLRAEMMLHPEIAWTNERMARRLNISVSRLYPLYRRLFSISPGRDLILMRVEKAKNMLRQGAPVARTAELLGYGSTFHFIRQFRQETGMTPIAFRQLNRKRKV